MIICYFISSGGQWEDSICYIGPSISFFLSFVLCNIKLSNLCNYYFFYLKLKIKSMSMSMSEDHCKPLPYVNWSSSVIHPSYPYTTANITCDVGHKFPNGRSSHEMTCGMTTYEWNYDQHLPCLSRLSVDIKV